MSYGIQIFNASLQELVHNSQNTFLADVIYNPRSNETRHYNPPAGTTVVAVPVVSGIDKNNHTNLIHSMSVSGNSVSWNLFSQVSWLQYAIFVYYKGV